MTDIRDTLGWNAIDEPTDELEAGAILAGKFKLLKQLGRGGMGASKCAF